MNDRRDPQFSTRDAGMAAFLRRLAKDRAHEHAFVARNFLLDQGVSGDRFNSYATIGGVADHGNYRSWNGTHERYLKGRVFRPGHDHGPPLILDPHDIDTCPETFQKIDPDSPFYRSDLGLHLIRVEELKFIAQLSNRPAAEIRQGMSAVTTSGHARDASYQMVADVPKRLVEADRAATCVCRLLGGRSGVVRASEEPYWPDRLRDQLGLLHLNPKLRSQGVIEIVVFRYPVSVVPRVSGADRQTRPLLPPTVLDGRHSPAFCPAPYNQPTGYVVDLGQDAPPIRREAVHPSVFFTPDHVFRVGEISRSITETASAEARAWHLTCVRDLTGCEDYGDQTDADLL